LYYAYLKTGSTAKATTAKSELDGKFADTKYQQLVHNAVTGEDKKKQNTVTAEYERSTTCSLKEILHGRLIRRDRRQHLWNNLLDAAIAIYRISVLPA
jgi:hypothetical protein